MSCAASHATSPGLFSSTLLRNFLFLLLMGLAGCSTLPHAVTPPDTTAKSATYPVLIVNHGWHTGFVLPATDVYPVLPFLRTRFPNATQLEFGWGDRAFYQSEAFSSGLAARALLWPTDTVMHVAAVPDDSSRFYAQTPVRKICLDDVQLKALLQFLADSFAPLEAEQQPISTGLYGDSAFYSGAGRYHLFNTCNQWTAKGLRSAGFDIMPALHWTAEGILDFLDGEVMLAPEGCPSPEAPSSQGKL